MSEWPYAPAAPAVAASSSPSSLDAASSLTSASAAAATSASESEPAAVAASSSSSSSAACCCCCLPLAADLRRLASAFLASLDTSGEARLRPAGQQQEQGQAVGGYLEGVTEAALQTDRHPGDACLGKGRPFHGAGETADRRSDSPLACLASLAAPASRKAHASFQDLKRLPADTQHRCRG